MPKAKRFPSLYVCSFSSIQICIFLHPLPFLWTKYPCFSFLSTLRHNTCFAQETFSVVNKSINLPCKGWHVSYFIQTDQSWRNCARRESLPKICTKTIQNVLVQEKIGCLMLCPKRKYDCDMIINKQIQIHLLMNSSITL